MKAPVVKIEERDANELRFWGRQQIAPRTVQVENPAFDATPVEFITGIITEEGIIDPQHIFHRSDTRS